MTTTELEQVIQEYFLNIYNKVYIGKISIQKLDPVGYCVRLGMDRPNKPTVIYAELEDDKFLKYLKEQIKSMNVHLTNYGELSLVQPFDKCKSNESRRIN